ncbi:acetyltransferase [Kiloniella litopenaei]|uniref:Acetyltransferase n=1 Tax=Kiloniella litopenaei TaxID=1549748 RepID=A0A0M2R179_9PROT|nr:GNAT family acetyltransferase [Kiloniella litopenaei]KKJ75652.1 acetyltransferase [Kiloniella litopenaei]
MNIRSYRPEDRAGIIRLWEEDDPNPSPWNRAADILDNKQSYQPGLLFIAEDSGTIVGSTMAGYDGRRGWIYSVVVAPSHRRQGIASKLLALAEQELISLGCTKLNLQVRDGNEGAVKLYESLGYRIEPRVSMGKRLGR